MSFRPFGENPRVVIIGGGPCGIGASIKLNELNHENWTLYEEFHEVGGLSYSYTDEKGFCYDFGTHVLFSHYQYFDDVLEKLGPEHLKQVREAWIIMQAGDDPIPYPLQNNVHKLRPDAAYKCIEGLLQLEREKAACEATNTKMPKPTHFGEWMEQNFGKGICEVFLTPYNRKVWAHPAHEMNVEWMGERVSAVKIENLLKLLIYGGEDGGYGPNHFFLFPKYGGTGMAWKTVASHLPSQNIKLNTRLRHIDGPAKKLILEDTRTGQIFEDHYDVLISTLPIKELCLSVLNKEALPKTLTPPFKLSDTPAQLPNLMECAQKFKHSRTHVVGFGIDLPLPEELKKYTWFYFPNSDCSFYRGCILNAFSPYMVPKVDQQYSILFEIAESTHQPRPCQEELIAQVFEEAVKYKLIPDRNAPIVSTFYKTVKYGYPTPFVGRNQLLDKMHPVLEKEFGILSRGRFGNWKYEVANQDHSFAQGVEAASYILNEPNSDFPNQRTFQTPDFVNDPKNRSEQKFEGFLTKEERLKQRATTDPTAQTMQVQA